MKTVKMKTSELSGPALDLAVAEAVGVELYNKHHEEDLRILIDPGICTTWAPSSNWHQCGTLIERHEVDFHGHLNGDRVYMARCREIGDVWFGGSSPLIAICRAIVAAKLGDEVEVPEELCTH